MNTSNTNVSNRLVLDWSRVIEGLYIVFVAGSALVILELLTYWATDQQQIDRIREAYFKSYASLYVKSSLPDYSTQTCQHAQQVA